MVSRTGGSGGGLINVTSQKGVVVKALKLVDNASGVLTDLVEVIPETDQDVAKKVVLDVTCDSMSSGDGQWLISGQGGARASFAKTGTKITTNAAGDAINAGASGNIVADLDNKLVSGDRLTYLTNGSLLEVVADVAAGSDKTIAVKNVGDTNMSGSGGDDLVQAPPRGSSVEFIAEVGDRIFFDPVTGSVLLDTIGWKPKKPGAYGEETP